MVSFISIYMHSTSIFGINTFFPEMKIKRKVARVANQTTSAELVASIDDLLMHILLLLPTKSLVLFKSVSKHWLALITNPRFSLLRNPNPNPAVGLYLQRLAFGVGPTFQYFPLGQQSAQTLPFQDLKFATVPSGLILERSCNGLLLYSLVESCPWSYKGYILNPNTKQFRKLPEPFPTDSPMLICGLSLAFEPSRSPDYNVVYLCVSDDGDPENMLQIWIYSSKTGKWRNSCEIPNAEIHFCNGVYWNGSIHWIKNNWEAKILYFNVHQESLHWMSRPSNWDDELETTGIYFGESCDHLHLTRMTAPSRIQFNVYELKRDYSEWFVKYKVDLTGVTMAFPSMIRATRFGVYAFSVRTLVRAKREEDSFLVLEIPGKVICFNLTSKTCIKVGDFDVKVGEDGEIFPFHWTRSFDYIESECFL